MRAVMLWPAHPEAVDWDGKTLDWSKVPMPPTPWFVQGPRGGWYEAVGEVSADASDQHPDYFIRNMIAVRFRSEGVRYLRPGTRRYREALGQIATS